jgi:hypothetical protein
MEDSNLHGGVERGDAVTTENVVLLGEFSLSVEEIAFFDEQILLQTLSDPIYPFREDFEHFELKLARGLISYHFVAFFCDWFET